MKLGAGAPQTRCGGVLGDIERFGDLRQRQFFDFVEHEHLTERGRHRIQNPIEGFAAPPVCQDFLGERTSIRGLRGVFSLTHLLEAVRQPAASVASQPQRHAEDERALMTLLDV